MRLVLDIFPQDIEAVNFCRQSRSDCRARWVLGFRNFPRRTGGVGGYHRLELQFTNDVAALAERHHVALHGLDRFQGRASWRHQLIADRQKPFGDDVQAGGRHQVVDVGDAPRDRILDRDHAKVDVAGDKRGKAIFEGGAGYRLVLGIGFATGKMRIRPRFSLIDDLLFCHARSFRRDPYADLQV